MRHLTKATAVLGVAALALLAAGCNKGPAEAALTVADQALEAAKPELARFTPDELASLTTAIADARAQFDKGSYTEALKAAQGLPARIEAAVAAAAAKREELTKAWAGLSETLEPAVSALTAKLAELAAMTKLPKGMDAAALASAQSELAAISTAWSEAGELFRNGDVAAALEAAQDVKAKAEALSGLVGVTPGAPVAVAAK